MCFIQLKPGSCGKHLNQTGISQANTKKMGWESNYQIIPACKHLGLTHSELAALSMLQSSAPQALTRLSNSINAS